MNLIICPLRNGLSLTRKALPTFLAQDIGDVEVLFIDNASTDGTQEWLRSLEVGVLLNSTPMSVAQSWNTGLNIVFKSGAGYALVVNNDVLLRPDTYRCLVEDGGPFVTAVGNGDKSCVLPPWHPPMAAPRPNPDYSCFLIRKECWQRVPFDESFTGAYGEDACHHLCLHRAGIHAKCIDLPFYHVASGTLKSSTEQDQQAIRIAADQNRARFKEKFGVEIGSPEYYALFTAAGE